MATDHTYRAADQAQRIRKGETFTLTGDQIKGLEFLRWARTMDSDFDVNAPVQPTDLRGENAADHWSNFGAMLGRLGQAIG